MQPMSLLFKDDVNNFSSMNKFESEQTVRTSNETQSPMYESATYKIGSDSSEGEIDNDSEFHHHEKKRANLPKLLDYFFVKCIFKWMETVYIKNPTIHMREMNDAETKHKDFSRLFSPPDQLMFSKLSENCNLTESLSNVYAAKLIDFYFPVHDLKISRDILLLLEVLSELLDKELMLLHVDKHGNYMIDSEIGKVDHKDDFNFYSAKEERHKLSIEEQQLQASVDEVLDIVITIISSIPGFLKTLLHCNVQTVETIFELSVIKHIMLESASSINFTILPMLQCAPKRALIYFDKLSPFLNNDVNGLIDKKYFGFSADGGEAPASVLFLQEKRDQLFSAFTTYSLRSIFVSITQMKKDLQLQAADIRSIQRLLDIEYEQSQFPFVYIVSDLMFQIILFTSFQFAVLFVFAKFKSELYIVLSQIALYCTLYFVAREIMQVFSARTKNEFFALFSFWNFVDWVSIGLVLGTYFLLDYELSIDTTDMDMMSKEVRSIAALATLLQGLKFVGMLRLCNEELAVFIVSLTQILIDARWFLMIMSIILISFSQVFLVLFIDEDDTPCIDDDLLGDSSDINSILSEIESNQTLSYEVANCYVETHYKRSYEMLLGDWDMDLYDSDIRYISFAVVSVMSEFHALTNFLFLIFQSLLFS